METSTPAHSAHSAHAGGRPGLLINRSFTLLWTGESISNLGDTVISAALVLWVGSTLAHGFAWVALAVAGVLAAQYLPQVFVAPVAGVYVDRWDRRKTMLRMDAFRTILIGGLTALAFISSVPTAILLAAVYITVFSESVAAQFFNPSRLAVIGDLVPEEDYAKATGFSQASFGLSVLIGPAIAAPLVVAFGAEWALLIDAVSFAFSYLMVSQIRPLPGHTSFRAVHHDIREEAQREQREVREEQRQEVRVDATPNPLEETGGHGLHGMWADMRAGLWLLMRNRVLRALAAGAVFANLGMGAVIALAYFFVVDYLHASPSVFGFVSTTFGGGAILGALIIALFAERLGEERVLIASLLVMGVAMTVLGRSNGPVVAFGAAAGFGAAFAAVEVITGPLILRGAPSEYVGRVSSALTPLGSFATLIGIGVAGALLAGPLQRLNVTFAGQHFGPVDSAFTLAGVIVFFGGIYAWMLLASMPKTATAKPTAPVSGGDAAADAVDVQIAPGNGGTDDTGDTAEHEEQTEQENQEEHREQREQTLTY